jgi:hypothetical protein
MTFNQDKFKLKQLVTITPALQKLCKGILHMNEEERHPHIHELRKE